MSRFGLRVRGTTPVSQWMAAANIVSRIQTGTITIANATSSNTATIGAVVLNRSVILYGGDTATDTSADPRFALCAVVLTNATTVTASRNSTTGSSIVPYTVIEFAFGVTKSVQAGSVVIAGASSSNTGTVTSVDTAKSLLLWNGSTTDNSTYTSDRTRGNLVLTDAVTITATRAGTTGGLSLFYTLVEFA